VKVDGGGLQLSVAMAASGLWMSGELMVDTSFGYGNYQIVVKNALANHNENVVFGAFIWDETNPTYNREIDIMEASRFGDPFNPLNAQFVIAPWNIDGRINRFTIPVSATSATLTLQWSPTALVMTISCPETGYSFSWEPTDSSIIPVPSGNERLHLNAWQNFGNGPTDSQPVTFTVESFSFSLSDTVIAPRALNGSGSTLGNLSPPIENLTIFNDTGLASPTPTPYWYYPGRIDPPPATTAMSNSTSPSPISPAKTTPSPTPYFYWIGRDAPPAAAPKAPNLVPAPAPISNSPPSKVGPSLIVSQPSSADMSFPHSLVVFALIGSVVSVFS
jgi:hypothetical protein